MKTFREVLAEKEAAGFQYGPEPYNVEFDWNLCETQVQMALQAERVKMLEIFLTLLLSLMSKKDLKREVRAMLETEKK